MSKPEKFFFPLMVFAAVIGVWLFLRRPQAATINQPSTAASGVPNYATESPTNYDVQAPNIPAQPLVYLSDPGNPNPAGPDRTVPPTYLSFNFGPGHDLTKRPASDLHKVQLAASGKCGGKCGGCSGSGSGGCRPANTFPDGSGQTPLASSKAAQYENAPDSFLSIALANLAAQGDDTFTQSPSVPNLHGTAIFDNNEIPV